MEATHGERTLIDINATVAKYKEVIPSPLPLHALTGCDTVPKLYGIGKKKALNVLLKNKLDCVLDMNSSIEEVHEAAGQFIGLCYGVKSQHDMSTIHYQLWNKRTKSGKLSPSPKLCSIPVERTACTCSIDNMGK